jgi:ribonucleoside-triphosphate reductase
MYKVRKRDGNEASFDVKKISSAVRKAFQACDRQFDDSIIDMIALRITSDFEPKIKDGLIDVEDIQDSAEKVLSEAGYTDVAKAYILYRRQRENIRNIKATTLDYKNLVDSYLHGMEHDSSEPSYSVGGLILSNSAAITSNYWLYEAYDEEISAAHKAGDIHIHDLNMLAGFSAGWSIRLLIQQGLTGVAKRVSRGPARHLSTLCSQMVNFLGIIQNEWAGAQSFSGFDTYLAPYVKEDRLSYEQVKQAVQSFIYEINTASRWGTQKPFISLTMDWTVPDDLKDEHAWIAAEQMDFTYGECQQEMDMLNRAFIEVMMEGDYSSNRFEFPIPTYSLTNAFDWSDTENNRLLFEMAYRYGIPYFANYRHPERRNGDVREMISLKEPDYAKLYDQAGGYCGSGEHTGSIGVVTINLPRLAYSSANEQEFFKRLDKMMDIAARSLKVKRDILSRFLDGGLYPYTSRYLGSFDRHFSTIGTIGVNEMCLNAGWIAEDLSGERAQAFAGRVLLHMRERLKTYQKEYHSLYSLAAPPAETTAHSLAKADKQLYPDIITAGQDGVPYYTNSSQLPAGYRGDLFTALDIQAELQSYYNGASVFEIYPDESFDSWQEAAVLIRKITEHYSLPYLTLTPTYSVCRDHGWISGEVHACPVCSKQTEVYSRIAGNYRELSEWNEGKLQEYHDRTKRDQ